MKRVPRANPERSHSRKRRRQAPFSFLDLFVTAVGFTSVSCPRLLNSTKLRSKVRAFAVAAQVVECAGPCRITTIAGKKAYVIAAMRPLVASAEASTPARGLFGFIPLVR